MSNEALKPCPFCGTPAAIESQFGREWWVQCTAGGCGASDGGLYTGPREAAERWNRRALASLPEGAETAKERFYRFEADEEKDPVERLRFFCSLAMKGQDWLDVEPFFDAITGRAAIDEATKP